MDIEQIIKKNREQNNKVDYFEEFVLLFESEITTVDIENICSAEFLFTKFSDHSDIQRYVAKKKTVYGYRNVLSELKKKEKNLLIIVARFYTKDFGFIILIDKITLNVLGVLKSLNSNYEKVKKINEFNDSRGFKSNYIDFHKGIRVK